MKGYLIDSYNRGFMNVEYSGLKDLQKFVGGSIDCAYQWPSGDTLYVDEEGMLKDPDVFFFLKERTDQPFAGNGILVGKERDGRENDDPAMSMAELMVKIRFGMAR